MRVKNLITALLAALLLVSLCSCDIGEVIEDETVSIAEDASKQAMLYSKELSTVQEGEFTATYSYGDDDFECYAIWCENDIENVELIPIEEDPETSEVKIAGEALCHFDKISAGEALVIDIYIPELIPNTAIKYTCGGNEYFVSIAYNLRDGGILFCELNI